MSGTSDWLQFYQPNNHSDQPPLTAAMGWTGEIPTDPAATATNSPQLGRVNRTNNTRRRTRASRRTPTTLVNTDTTNFRAMVQQFTGGGDQVFNSGDGSSANQYLGSYNNNNNNNSANLSFGIGPSGSVMAAAAAAGGPTGGYNLQFRQSIGGGDGGGGGQQYYQGEFLQSLQNYTTSEAAGEEVGPTQGRGSSFLH